MGKKKLKKFGKASKWLSLIGLGGLIVAVSKVLPKKQAKKTKAYANNLTDFVKKEAKEIAELVNKEETWDEYKKDSSSIYRDYFVPHLGNNFEPKILRPKPLMAIALGAILFKVLAILLIFTMLSPLAWQTEDMTKDILALTNAARAEAGLPGLELDPELTRAAKAKATDMATKDYFDHYGPDGKSPWAWINRNTYPYQYAGENLAMNFSTATSVHSALMQSPTHKENILEANYTDIGLAQITAEINGVETTLLVQMFGATKASLAKTAVAGEKVALEPSPVPDNTEQASAPDGTGQAPVPDNTEQASAPDDKGKTAPAASEPSNDTEVNERQTAPGTQPIPSNSGQSGGLADPETGPEKQQVSASQRSEPVLNPVNQEPQVVKAETDSKAAWINKTSTYVFLGVFLLLALFLSINLVIQIRHQHKDVIVHTLVVLLLLMGLMAITLIVWPEATVSDILLL